MARKITAIAPHKSFEFQRKKVAAYARVSSGKDAMLHSLSAQVSYYSKMIQSRPKWQYVGVYADEAATGTKDNRNEFQRMISDCKSGNIDMIITKSISRFARNTVTLLETVRKLKELNVDVYFEEQNIHSMSGDGELMLTILASFAQEESLSVSENCKWRIRNEFKQGKMPMSLKRLYGYVRTSDGGFAIVEKEAEVIRYIFNAYLEGLSVKTITTKLLADSAPPPNGIQWGQKAVRYILSNEKYIGDLLLQKEFISDHLSKKKTKNNGQLNQYYVENNHKPIVSREIFNAVQSEIQKRAEKYTGHSEVKSFPFTKKIVCEHCGAYYTRKVCHCSDKYRRAFWNCATYLRHGKAFCPAKKIPEETLYKLSCEVLGIDEFNENIFSDKIKEITIPEWYKVTFVFWDGERVTKVWQDKSRKWTEEMKAENYDKLRKGHKS